MYNLIIKYGLDGDLIDDKVYRIKFNWDKCVAAFYYSWGRDTDPIEEGIINDYPFGELPIDFVKKFDGWEINMKYSGIVDGSNIKVFILDITEIERERKLKLLDI